MDSSNQDKRGGVSSMISFLYMGFVGVLGFCGIHLLFCLITSWVLGHPFSTIVYVTAATIVTGTMITFTFAFIMALNLVFTLFTNFSQMGQNIFGGGAGMGMGMGMGSTQRHSMASTERDNSPENFERFDASNMKLD